MLLVWGSLARRSLGPYSVRSNEGGTGGFAGVLGSQSMVEASRADMVECPKTRRGRRSPSPWLKPPACLIRRIHRCAVEYITAANEHSWTSAPVMGPNHHHARSPPGVLTPPLSDEECSGFNCYRLTGLLHPWVRVGLVFSLGV